MTFLIVLVCTIVLSIILKPAIKKVPIVWYLVAIVLVVLYIAGLQGILPNFLRALAFALIQRGTLAVSLFTVVMYIGVLPHTSKLRMRMIQIRTELSLLACILILGHIIAYAMNYITQISLGIPIGPYIATGLVAGIMLFILLLMLGITSLGVVKSHMTTHAWILIQKWSYVFYGLIYFHTLAMLLPSALSGGATAIQSEIIYTVVFGLYLILRIIRAVINRREKTESSSAVQDKPSNDVVETA